MFSTRAYDSEKISLGTLGRSWNTCPSGRERLINISQTLGQEPNCRWGHIPQDWPLLTFRQGKSLSPHSLKTNQFKGCTVLPIILCLVADALFCPWKPYKNLVTTEWHGFCPLHSIARAFVPPARKTQQTGIFCGKSFIAYIFRSKRENGETPSLLRRIILRLGRVTPWLAAAHRPSCRHGEGRAHGVENYPWHMRRLFVYHLEHRMSAPSCNGKCEGGSPHVCISINTLILCLLTYRLDSTQPAKDSEISATL